MKRIPSLVGSALTAIALLTNFGPASAANWTGDMKSGKPAFKSIGPLAFGPDGVLFVADTKGASIVALATGDIKASSAKDLKVDGINKKIANLLGTTPDKILIDDIAVNPISHNTYVAVS